MAYHSLKMACIKNNPDKKIIFGTGNLNSHMVLVGEAPGAEEVKAGKPFVGKAGKNLDGFLRSLEVNREDIYITNVVKFRPTIVNPETGRINNKQPSWDDVDSFLYYLNREIEIINPLVVVTLGAISLKSLYKRSSSVGLCHGRSFKTKKGYSIFCLYHPASIIYKAELLETYRRDLDNLKKYLLASGERIA